MSNNATSGFDLYRRPDNPQETSHLCSNSYYTGFFVAEMTCSVIKATNHHPRGYYFMPDLTVSNADKLLLEKANHAVMAGNGSISPIKGGFNLKARGKQRVKMALAFFDAHPVVSGNRARNRLALLRHACEYLSVHHGHKVHEQKTVAMDTVREKLRALKEEGVCEYTYEPENICTDCTGYFLSGVIDGDGSIGTKKRGNHVQQPFFMAAMKERDTLELLQEFIGCGAVRFRKDGVYHYEINRVPALKTICSLFLDRYPLQHVQQRQNMKKLRRILNDYTRKSDTKYRA